MENKKILVFCGGHIVSGAEIMTLSYLEQLKLQGVELHCITNAWGNKEFDKRLEALNIPYTPTKLGFIYPRKFMWTLDTLLNFPCALSKIKKVIKSFNPNVCYHVSFRSIFMLQNFIKIPHILHVHDNISQTRFNKLVVKTIEKQTNRFIAVSESTRSHLLDLGIDKTKICLLYNGTSITDEANLSKKSETFSIGIVGQIIPIKGHLLLVEALSEFKQKVTSSFILKIFGEGDETFIGELKGKISEYELDENVEWMGFFDNKTEIYKQIDLVVVPTISVEPFGLTIIEGGVNKVLALASNQGGPAEIIQDKINGYLFKPNDSKSLFLALKFINENSDINNQCIENNFKRVTSDFNSETQAQKLLNYLSVK